MLSSGGHVPLRLAIAQAGGCLQHARSLLAAALSADAASLLQAGCSSSCGSAGDGRSISTTRSIYMGRAFVRENLEKSAAKSSLFTRENYQHLAKHRWSLTACEQVLSKHQRARKPHRFNSRDLTNEIKATTSLTQLQQLVADRAHDMSGIHLCVAIQQTSHALFTRDAPDYTAAALLLHSLCQRLPGQLGALNGPSICNCLASFVRCRYSPPGELLQAMLEELLANGCEKLQQAHVVALSHLVYALSRLVQPQGHWPLLQAVLERTIIVLRQMAEEAPGFVAAQQQAAQQVQQHLDRLESSSSTGASGGSADAAAPAASPAPSAAAAAAAGGNELASGHAAAAAARSPAYVSAGANAVALLLYTLDKAGVSSPEVADALHAWMVMPGMLDVVRPTGLMQLWGVIRSQHARRLAAADSGEISADDAGVADLAPHSDAGGGGAVGEEAAAPGVLQALAGVTKGKLPYFSEKEMGQVLAALTALQYDDKQLLEAAATAMRALTDAGGLPPATAVTAAVAASRLSFHEPALLQPALLLAAQRPGELNGTHAGRLLYAAAALPADVAAAQAALVEEALHAASDARGPVPERPAGSNAAWVDALADDLAGRLAELKPREVAHVLAAFSLLPGVQLHAGLFGAAARHVEAHAHMFSRCADVELIAAAFERLGFREGLPALRALQQQTQANLGTAAAAAQ